MRAGIALGSNLGESAVRMEEASAFLRTLSCSAHFLRSSLWRTEPVDCPPGSPEFLNAVVEIDWEGSPEELLAALLAFERRAGRPPAETRPRNAPRPIDLDLLYCGNLVRKTAELTLPHPRLARRSFVLGPLAEIAPELRLPGFSLTVRELYERLSENHPRVGA
ncbi:2-amino-4-hydroxy-6-hydroxymethyldihydropteridinediphosphokinase [Methylacidimicrobium sp. AP8]|uniref:2-amino-4-hydroxy-6- hydroxymethyldihydropteridine diphosphokinase n=1 Tax=Methylacidimicrobium sp. AP8 TaxID=2730359 RepID=UPI0018C02F93|nr:2-amino-4-hydroxy-6-hydroxymethyldihydropteridine diphosphokinase [Methylacidimicrobium sp. AP8]CAB4244239.1 2-amino-4-hydroxy-6-hydroxymethyldihydropteridinediphosphokinase [Methylacidimicrobium sp. AP8]